MIKTTNRNSNSIFDQRTQQPVSRAALRSCRSMAMELAANQSKTVSQSGTIQAFIKDIPV